MKRFRRARPSRPLRRRVVVVTEGTVTEPLYLRLYGRIHGPDSLFVEPIPLGQDPRSVVERAIEERQESQSDPDAEDDSFWAMFDRDNHESFLEAVHLAKAKDIPTAVSNPSFELWLILHYELLDRPVTADDCRRRLRELCPDYGRAKQFADAEVIEHQHGDAVSRARNLIRRRSEEDTPLGNPSTTVVELTEYVRLWAR